MSRTAAVRGLSVTRGSTWEDAYEYVEEDGITPINLTGYKARMQIRTGDGTGTSTSNLILTLTTEDNTLRIETLDGRGVPNLVRFFVPPSVHAVLNPNNLRKIKYSYDLELYDETADPEYVIPFLRGKVSVRNEVTRSP